MEVSEREKAIDGLEQKHNVKLNRKRRRALMEMSEIAFAAAALGLDIASCMKVTNLYLPLFAMSHSTLFVAVRVLRRWI